jgi:hypothetical protein
MFTQFNIKSWNLKKKSKLTLANILNLRYELWGQENPINSK